MKPKASRPSKEAGRAGKESGQAPEKPRSRWGSLFFVAALAFVIIYMVWIVAHNNPGGAVGKPAPDFTAMTADRREVKFSGQLDKPTLLVFWMERSDPAREELRWLAAQYPALQGRGISVVAVNLDPSFDRGVGAAKALDLPFLSLFDTNRTSASNYQPVVVPCTFFIDGKGQVTEFLAGFHDLLRQDVEKWKP